MFTLFPVFLSIASLLLIIIGIKVLCDWDWDKERDAENLEKLAKRDTGKGDTK